MSRQLHIFVSLAVLLIFIPAVSADLYWETHMTTSGIPGVQNGDDISKTFMNKDGMRMERKDGITIMNYEKGMIYQLDFDKKTYEEVRLDSMLQGHDEAVQYMQNMIKSMSEDITIEKTDETKKINGYDCTKYVVTVMGMPSETWITKDVEGFAELQNATKKHIEKYKNNPLLKNMLGNPAFEKLEGFPIMSVSQVGQMRSVSNVTKIEKKKLDADLFLPPSDYAKVESSSDSPFGR
ncbi:DUF4412 domain-containing protein [bacterium]|nr:DUF4412 domain-containing protein [candidate division CSSED10-310 bacterium]